MTDMLPCPFCGGEATIEKDYTANCFGEEKVTLRTECTVCGAKPYWETVQGTTDKLRELREKIETAEFELKERWNKRKVDDG